MDAAPASRPTLDLAAGQRLNGLVVRSAVVAALGGLLFGFDTAVISGTTEALQRVFNLDTLWLGFTVAVALIGTIVGSVIIGRPADAIGRRRTLLIIAVGYFISAIGCAVASNWTMFVIARFVGGLAIGGASVVAPLYIAEIAPSRWRGRLVGLNQLNVVSGILLSFVSNYFLARYLDFDTAWRWMLGIVAIPSAAFFVMTLAIPESPRWLVRMGRLDEARAILSRLLGAGLEEQELGAIRESLQSEPGDARATLFQARYARYIFLAWALAMFNQLSGINALMYYAPRIFGMAGATRSSALLQSVAVGGTNLIFTLLAMFVIDRFGRRVLMLIGSAGTALSLASVAWQFHRGAAASGTVVLASLLCFIAFFAASQGAVIWVFISEIFPNAVRAKGQALGSFTHWVMAAAVSWTFPIFAERSGAGAFAFFAGMMLLQFLFAWGVMPETKGGTLEDIEQRLGGERFAASR